MDPGNEVVLCITICVGLIKLRSGWRTCALVFLWGGVLLAPVAFFLGPSAQSPAYMHIFGVRLGNVSPAWLAMVAVPLFRLIVWQYRVLTDPDMRSLFVRVGTPKGGSELRCKGSGRRLAWKPW